MQVGFVTVVKKAIPADGTDFNFNLSSEEAESSANFDLDDSSESDTGENLPNQIEYNVAPGEVTISEGVLPAGWNLADLTCTGVIPTVDKTKRLVSFTLLNRVEVVCTFTNTKTTYQDLAVSTTAKPRFDRDYDWTIDKNLAAGQAASVKSPTTNVSVDYSVMVKASAPKDSNFVVDGVISVENSNAAAINGVTLSDSLPGAQCAIETTGGTAVTGPISIPRGTTNFNYTCEMPAGTTEATAGTNTVKATWDAASYYGTDGEASASKDFTFTGVEPTVTDDKVTVTDNKFDLGMLPGGNEVTAEQASKTFDYSIKWPGVSGECTPYGNIATYKESDGGTGSDSASVQVCIGANLEVTKNVQGSFNRAYSWKIDKTPLLNGQPVADNTKYNTNANGEVTIDYRVTVTPQPYVDSNWAMTGTMTVTNPNKWQDVSATLTDSVDVGGDAVCAVTGQTSPGTGTDLDPTKAGFQTVIPKNSSVEFDYGCDFGSQPRYTGTNTARVDWSKAEASTPGEVDEGTAEVTAGSWTQSPLNQNVTVTDDEFTFDPAWTIDGADGTTPQSKDYEVTWTVPAADAGQCVPFTNTAKVSATEALASEDATILACLPAGLSVSKTVDASYDRTYTWDIDKKAKTEGTVNADSDGKATVGYGITVTGEGYTDTKSMGGTITVANANQFGGDVETTVSDSTSLAGLVCTVDATHDVNLNAAGIQINVPQATLVDGNWIPGTATVNYACDPSNVAESDYTGGTNTAKIAWAGGEATGPAKPIEFKPRTITDETVKVFDDQAAPGGDGTEVGTVSWSEVKDKATRSKAFPYELEHVVDPGTCGTFTNKAWIELEGDGSENPSDEATATVCGQAGLQVSKTAKASFDRLYKWNVTKDVDKTQQTIAPDGKATFNYTVTAVPNGFDDFGETLGGTITLTNPNNFAGGAITATLTDTVGIGGVTCEIQATDYDLNTEGLQVLVPANAGENNGIVVLDYTCDGVPASYTGTNTVDVSWTDVTGDKKSTRATAKVEYALDTEYDKTVLVFDDKVYETEYPELLGEATWNKEKTPTAFPYDLKFGGTPGTCSDYTNTAIVTEKGWNQATLASDSEPVTVCAEQDLVVSKDATATYDRDYDWKVEKKADETSFKVDGNGKVTAGYKVAATQDGYTDSKWKLAGTITVANPNDFGSITADVTDALNVEGITCSVAEGQDVVVAAGKTATLDYTCEVSAGVAEADYTGKITNTATATWGGNRSASSGPVDVDFALATETDTEIRVADDHYAGNDGVLGTVTRDQSPQTFAYDVQWQGVAGKCTTFTNTAVLEGDDDNPEGNESSADIEVCVEDGLTVVKTVDAGFTRDYDWSIDKQVDQGKFTVDGNGKATADYTVKALLDGHKDQDWAMSGVITVFNPNQQEAITVDVTDTPEIPGAVCTVANGTGVNVPAATEADGEVSNGTATVQYNCTFAGGVSAGDYTGKKNHTIVSWKGVDGMDRTVTNSAPIVFTQTGSIDETVTVVDDKTVPGAEHDLGTASVSEAPKTFAPYPVELQGTAGQCTTYTNTAVLNEETATDGKDANNKASQEVEVCAKAGLQVEKDAAASFDRLYTWDVKKSVDSTKQTIAPDGSATFTYTVSAEPKEKVDTGFTLDGKITLTNPNQFAGGAITATVKDTAGIAGLTCDITNPTDLDPDQDGFQVLVPAGTDGNPGIGELAYHCGGTPAAYNGTNTADVTWTDAAGDPKSAKATAGFAYEAANVTDETVQVFDDKAGTVGEPVLLGTAHWNDGPTAFDAYDLSFPGVLGTCTDYTNTATLAGVAGEPRAMAAAGETNILATDEQTVTVCVEADLDVSKDATATYDRDYDWKIEKQVDETDFKVDGEGKVVANYTVAATQDAHTDSGWTLGGKTTVHNPNDFGSITADVTDALNIAGITCTVADGADVQIAAGATATLDYTCNVAAGVDEAKYTGFLKNTATAAWGDGRTASSDPVDVDFTLDQATDASVDVYDDKTNPEAEPVKLGTATLGGENVFTYAQELVGTAGKCTTFTNTAVLKEKAGSNEDNTDSVSVEVCVETGMTVVKTVKAGFTRDYDWSIDKQVEKGKFTVDGNGKATANYTVTASLDGHADQDWTMSGSIDVFNPNQQGELSVDISDATSVPGATCTVAGGGTDVVVPAATVVDGEVVSGKTTVSYDCMIDAKLLEADYSGHTNTATVSWSGVDGEDRTASFDADVLFTQTGSIDETVNVLDDKTVPGATHDLGTVSVGDNEDARTFTYPVELAGVAGQCTIYTNNAVLEESTENGPAEVMPTSAAGDNTDSTDVTVCAKEGLSVSKSAEASFDREYLWDLDKKVSATKAEIGLDGTATFDYTVAATPSGFEDSNHAVSGKITLSNPNRFAEGAITATVSENIDIQGVACKVDAKDADESTEGLQVLVPAGTDGEPGTVVLDYTCTGTPRDMDYTGANTATASWENAKGDAVSATGTAEVNYAEAGSTNKDLEVLDDKAGTVAAPVSLGTADWNPDGVSTEFTYQVVFTNPDPDAPDGTCTTHTNTATSVATDDASTSVEVCVRVGAPTVEKTVTGTRQNADGSWSITYKLEVTNNDDVQGRYSLEDTLSFGDGITVTDASWTGPTAGDSGDWDLATPDYTEVLAADKLIDAGTTEAYEVTVAATVAAGVVGTEAGNCELVEGEDGTGFLNSATITANGQGTEATACAEPTTPEIAKTATGDPVLDEATGTWKVSYTLDVDNTTGHDSHYDLLDSPAFAAGTQIEGWNVVSVGEDTPATTLDGTTVPVAIADDTPIAAGTKHAYRVTFTVDLAGLDLESKRECEGAGSGFFNTARLTSGNQTDSDEDCVKIPATGNPDIAKTVTSASQQPDGSWAVDYKVTVRGDVASPGIYSLDDTLAFGAGATIDSATWSGPDGADGAWSAPDTDPATTLATNKFLAAGDTHEYSISVTATVAAGTTGSAAADCELTEGEDGTGFLNTAGITSNGQDREARACAAPVAPSLDKQALELVQHENADGNWDGTWDASYKLIVTNPGTEGASANYTLTDTPAFADGVTVNDRHVSSTDVVVNEAWHGKDSTDELVAANQVLDPGAVHTFTVIVNVSLTSAINDADRVCGSDGHGLLNTGVLTAGNESDQDTACLEIPVPSSNVVKTAVSAEENADGSWDARYTVVVNNTSDVATRYDLTDTLRFGAGLTATGANWTLEGTAETGSWENPGTQTGTVLAADRNLEARDSHTYVVHVVAVLADGVIGSEAGTCQPEDTNTNGGFLNEAILSANGKTTASRDCATPVKNPRSYSLVKTSDPASGTIVWPGDTVTYTLTVRNTGEFVYTGAVVTDEMAGWQHAATLDEGSLRLHGGESAIDGSKLVWTVGDLAVGEEKTLTYSITVDDEAWDEVLVNVATGNGDVPPSKTVHPTPDEEIVLPAPPVIVVPPLNPAPVVVGPPVNPAPVAVVSPRKPAPPLATTGADDSTLWILGSGALILLLGAAFVASSRRRKGEGN
ncbi:LPXTG cell wall anchor domain-containing protein [Arthrobacter sp. AQ5-05]|uniref:DUF7927 domain-containing protein n=1 Tax=Arthrobacter sp. AQ5-05 TaxID=2184581 RepID=UPI001C661659|nr:LPXTG cell wall anchor domain-containing protein [Arthrobacter sp. AQ5-05]